MTSQILIVLSPPTLQCVMVKEARCDALIRQGSLGLCCGAYPLLYAARLGGQAGKKNKEAGKQQVMSDARQQQNN